MADYSQTKAVKKVNRWKWDFKGWFIPVTLSGVIVLILVSVLTVYSSSGEKNERNEDDTHAIEESLAALEKQKAPFLKKKSILTIQERRQLQALENREAALKLEEPIVVQEILKLHDALPDQVIQPAIMPAFYTCRAELTARKPSDLTVTISGIKVALATTVYINGQPCNGKSRVSFGADQKAILQFNLDGDARAQVKGASRWMSILFTPA